MVTRKPVCDTVTNVKRVQCTVYTVHCVYSVLLDVTYREISIISHPPEKVVHNAYLHYIYNMCIYVCM